MSANGSVRRVDTTKGPPLRILSLDGGGVRGFSMLILLQELMHRTYVEIHGNAPTADQIPKPCDHFDLIGGTGTGGLIAIMLGRMRMDLETCKTVYTRMTRKVFETDKTIAGIPYTSTLFKASKLEEAIQECVREQTASENLQSVPQRNVSSASSASRNSAYSERSSTGGYLRSGNPNTAFYDKRPNRTKTAVTAVYKGTSPNGDSILLRSYDSRKEPAPEFKCTIWQAGRATSATQLAFKPIQIGQSVFLDEGAGKYNPSPQLLDEAVINEWPGRDVGVIVSIGTGKRPAGSNNTQHEWWEDFMVGGFADARRRLIAKIEGCETTHEYMVHEHLGRRGINPEAYYRLNVEVGVGGFGMNEWNALADISTSTRRYLKKPETETISNGAATKLAKIHFAKLRWEKHGSGPAVIERHSWEGQQEWHVPPPSNVMAVELPAEMPATRYESIPQLDSQPSQRQEIPQLDSRPSQRQTSTSNRYSQPQPQHQYQQYASPDDKFAVLPDDNNSYNGTYSPSSQTQHVSPMISRHSSESYAQNDMPNIAPLNIRHHREASASATGPPVPPKTPIQSDGYGYQGSPVSTRQAPRLPLPYLERDGPPPPVNMARKPTLS